MIGIEKFPGWMRFLGINAYGWKLRNRRFNKNFNKFQNFLEKSQYWDSKKLEEYQFQKIKFLLRDAAENVPFYGHHFADCGFNPLKFSCLDDLKKIETVTKSQLRDAGKQCLHYNYKQFKPQLCYSSGTTGEKFAYYIPEELRFSLKYATIWRQYSWAGVDLFDRRVTLGGRYFASKPPYWVCNYAENQLLLSIHHLNKTTIKQYLKKMKDFNPVFLQGHPSGVECLAKYLINRGKTFPLKAIFTTGETLSLEQRKKIEVAFDCKVFEEYGQGECVFSAQESTDHSGLHEVSEFGLIEFEPQKIDCFQQVIATSLWNQAMPFIRYRVEDLVEIPSVIPQNKGRIGLPVKIKRVLGRIDDSLTNTNGEMILAVSVRMTIKPLLKSYENYQLVQVGKKDFLLRITGSNSDRDVSTFKQKLEGLFGNGSNIEVAFVKSLTTGAGKLRNVVNEFGRKTGPI